MLVIAGAFVPAGHRSSPFAAPCGSPRHSVVVCGPLDTQSLQRVTWKTFDLFGHVLECWGLVMIANILRGVTTKGVSEPLFDPRASRTALEGRRGSGVSVCPSPQAREPSRQVSPAVLHNARAGDWLGVRLISR